MSGGFVGPRLSSEPWVIRVGDLNKYGCPTCGSAHGFTPIRAGGVGAWICTGCNTGCMLLADDLDRVPDGWKPGGGMPVQSHPRATAIPPEVERLQAAGWI